MGKKAPDEGFKKPANGDSERHDQMPGLEARRKRLEAELASRRSAELNDGKSEGANKSSYAKAFQLSTEFVAAIFVGTLLGYLIDRFLGTTPWGMIIFLLLGFVAGVLNVMRSAGVVAENRVTKTADNNDDNAKG